MAAVRQDYILRQIDLLRQFVARLAGARDGATLEQALQLALNLQEKLFAMPAVEFLRKPVDEQVANLMAGESKAAGHTRCLTYAELLQHTASLYSYRGREDLAAGALQLALQVTLHVALDEPADPDAVRSLVTDLLAAVDPQELHAPTREMLDEFVRRAG
jgi:hypothetical protein